MPASEVQLLKEDSCMKTTASDVLIDSIHDWGVDVVFGLPGDGINGIMEALRKRADKIRFIQVRHEEAAAFMACCSRKIHRPAWCLPCNFESWRAASARRALRCMRRKVRRRTEARENTIASNTSQTIPPGKTRDLPRKSIAIASTQALPHASSRSMTTCDLLSAL